MTGPRTILLASLYLIVLFETNENPPPRRHFELPDADDGAAGPLPQPPPELYPRCARDETEAKVRSNRIAVFFIK